jgi:hypothetical protein
VSEPVRELPPASPEPENEVKLSFLDHLRELRKRLGGRSSGSWQE